MPQREDICGIGGQFPICHSPNEGQQPYSSSSPDNTTTSRAEQQQSIQQQQQRQGSVTIHKLQQQSYAQQQLNQRFQTAASSPPLENNANNLSTGEQLEATQSSPQQQQQQPAGWRVKLYRLNMAGTWDDCGTGRITFYYARPHHSQSQTFQQSPHSQQSQALQQQVNKKSSSGGNIEASSTSLGGESAVAVSSDRNIFRELGEPMLCMRAESSSSLLHPNNHSSQHQSGNDNSTPPQKATPQRVLLRTRLLLNDSAYQVQGENIITWCEPFATGGGSQQQQQQQQADNNKSSNENQGKQQSGTGGVDLALSFQDNAGCKDVWSHIVQVQGCAANAVAAAVNESTGSSIWDPPHGPGDQQLHLSHSQHHHHHSGSSHQPLSPKQSSPPR